MAMTNLGPVSLKPKGAYDSTVSYTRLDVVEAFGGSYVALKELNGIAPVENTTNENWQCIAKRGSDGATGVKGDPGAAGAQGEKGAAGADGKSAYAYAKEGGYSSSESVFYQDLASLQGVAAELASI